MKKIKILFLFILVTSYQLLATAPTAQAVVHSANYQLPQYGFGAGGTNTNTSSSGYKLFGTAGEVDFGRPASSGYKAGSGLIYALKLNTPAAPTLSNPGNTYDRLKIVVNTSNNTSEVLYAISISTSNTFASNVQYVKSDQTMGPSLTTSDYKTFTNWGGAGGFFVSLLSPNTTYYVRARARIPSGSGFQETEWGPISSGVATGNSTLTFFLGSSTVNFNALTPGNSYTDATQTTTVTTTTNAYNGYVVYAKETQALSSGANTIPDYTGTNSSPTTWSGTGFGYNTSDTNLQSGPGSANRFSGSKYAGFVQNASTPGDPVADDITQQQSSEITNETFTISYKLVGTNTTPAGTYSNTILYTIMPTY